MLIEEIKAEFPDIKIMILEPFVLQGTVTIEQWDVFREEVRKRAVKAKEISEKYGLVFVPLQEKFDEVAKKLLLVIGWQMGFILLRWDMNL